jgi:hypothetical protein
MLQEISVTEIHHTNIVLYIVLCLGCIKCSQNIGKLFHFRLQAYGARRSFSLGPVQCSRLALSYGPNVAWWSPPPPYSRPVFLNCWALASTIPGSRLIKKRIYRAAVSQRLRTTALDKYYSGGVFTASGLWKAQVPERPWIKHSRLIIYWQNIWDTMTNINPWWVICITIFKEDNSLFWKSAIFWDILPSSSYMNRRFGGTYHLHLQGRISAEQETSESRWLGIMSCQSG